MKVLLFFCVVFIFDSSTATPFFEFHELRNHWEEYKKFYNKSYPEIEELGRFQIFEQNWKIVYVHNEQYMKNVVNYKLDLNQFADLTSVEFIEKFGSKHNNYVNMFPLNRNNIDDAPDALDWSHNGAVTPVKTQGECGGASYAVVDVYESQNFMTNGTLLALSVQEVLDCSSVCQNNTVESAYEYILVNGLASAMDYPNNTNGTCERGSIPSAIFSMAYITSNSTEDTLKQECASVGPVAVEVDATTWQLYTGGILSCSNFQGLNHAALVVGYGNDNGTDYWLVKNSWGTNWGESGYIKIARGNETQNCGISSSISYPFLF